MEFLQITYPFEDIVSEKIDLRVLFRHNPNYPVLVEQGEELFSVQPITPVIIVFLSTLGEVMYLYDYELKALVQGPLSREDLIEWVNP